MGIAMAMGYLVYRRGVRLGVVTAAGFALMLLLTWWGLEHPVGGIGRGTWMAILLAYAALASVLPVWLLLQPRDYLNSLLLYLGLGAVFLGFFVLSPDFAAPALNAHPEGAPPLFPFLFIVIACGAVSGFHGLVSSGTTSKQLDKETDGCMIGYGAMVGESLLGLAAVLATTAGFASAADWSAYYASWGAASGLAAKLAAFISGTGLFLSQLGVPRAFAEAFMSVIVVAFALTSIDSGARLLRYTFHEAGESLGIELLRNRYAATLCGVAAIGFFAFFQVDGRPAGLFVWALFGTTNQILAAMTLLAATVYLLRHKRPFLYTLLPMLLVLTVTVWAMASNLISYVAHGQWALTALGGTILALALWVCAEAVVVLRNLKRAAAPVPEPEGG
jgi:carbon starvation protein